MQFNSELDLTTAVTHARHRDIASCSVAATVPPSLTGCQFRGRYYYSTTGTHWRWCHAGRHLSQLPVDAGVGKLLVLGAALGCLSTCLTVAACLSYHTPFASSQDKQDAAGRTRQAMAATGQPYHYPHATPHAIPSCDQLMPRPHIACLTCHTYGYICRQCILCCL